jgi:subtilisin family serine protease
LAAAEYAFKRGTLVVAPSGNCGCEDPAPETPFILSVSATDENDQVASFSSTGKLVDLAAPGTNIATTAMYGLYLSDSGTSVASSIVAGVAALMFSVNPALTPSVVTRLLEETAVGGPTGGGRDRGVGHGRVDAFAAVSAAKDYRAVEPIGRSASASAGVAPVSASR